MYGRLRVESMISHFSIDLQDTCTLSLLVISYFSEALLSSTRYDLKDITFELLIISSIIRACACRHLLNFNDTNILLPPASIRADPGSNLARLRFKQSFYPWTTIDFRRLNLQSDSIRGFPEICRLDICSCHSSQRPINCNLMKKTSHEHIFTFRMRPYSY